MPLRRGEKVKFDRTADKRPPVVSRLFRKFRKLVKPC